MQVFVSLLLVVGSVLLFLFSAKQRDFDHADRLALLPIEADDPRAETPPIDDPRAEASSALFSEATTREER